MTRRVTVRGIINQEGKLYGQRLKERSGNSREYWCTPGGGLEDGESLHDGLTREIIEETGITPVIGRLLYIQQYNDEKREYIEFFFEITNTHDFQQVDLTATSHGHIEVAEQGFIDPTSTVLYPKFLQTADIAQDISSGTVKVASYL